MKYQRLEIERFLGGLPAAAPLRAAVAAGGVWPAVDAFEAADKAAVAAQGRYRRAARLALRATTFGTLAGALLLLPLDQFLNGAPKYAIGALQTVSLICTLGAVWWLGRRRPVDAWMQSRAEAEQARGAIFEAVLEAHPAGAYDAGTLTAEKLDCIQQAHIDDQLRYFDKASRRHAKAASRNSPLRLAGYVLIGAAFIVGGVGLIQVAEAFGFVGFAALHGVASLFTASDLSRAQLGLGTMASSILAHATARSMLEQDERNAALYTLTARRLRAYLERNRGDVRARAAAGDLASVTAFYRGARQILEAEHTAWLLSRPPRDPVKHTFEDV
jgi:hypothetical protein